MEERERRLTEEYDKKMYSLQKKLATLDEDYNLQLEFLESQLNAANEDNFEVMNKLLNILNKPYRNQKNIENYQSLSTDKEYQTFCGT